MRKLMTYMYDANKRKKFQRGPDILDCHHFTPTPGHLFPMSPTYRHTVGPPAKT